MIQEEHYFKNLIINNIFPNNLILACRSLSHLEKTANFLIQTLFNRNGLNETINYHQGKDYFIEIGDFEKKILKSEILTIIDHFAMTSFDSQKIKIYKINGMELMTPQAAVCLLKFMEEHNENIYGIFLSKASHVILPTLRSRAMIIHLRNNNIIADLKNEYPEVIDSLKQLLIKKNYNFWIKTINIKPKIGLDLANFGFLFFDSINQSIINQELLNINQTDLIKFLKLTINLADCLIYPNLNPKILIESWAGILLWKKNH